MTTKYHDTIDELKNQTQSMGILASQMLKDSVKALENFDMSLASDVRERRHELAKMDHDIEDRVLRTIALNQPRASDMRILGTILKIITYQLRGVFFFFSVRTYEESPRALQPLAGRL